MLRSAPGRSITSGRLAGGPCSTRRAVLYKDEMQRGSLRRALALAFKRTHRGPLRRVVLYEKPGCGLCAETFRSLSRLALEMPIEIVRVDVEREPTLFERYALRIPVVAANGRELDAAGVAEHALRDFVAA